MRTVTEIESTGEQTPTLEGHEADYLPSDAVQETATIVLPESEAPVDHNPTKPIIVLDGDSSQAAADTNDNHEVLHQEKTEPILADPGVPENVDFDERRPLTRILTSDEVTKLNERAEERLYLPSESAERMVDYFNKIPNMAEETISQENIEWVTAHQAGLTFIPRFGAFKRTLKRKGARYRQSVTHGPSELGPAIPREDSNVMGVLNGSQAVRQIQHVMGLSGQVTIPLWHSGFWITIRQPSESAILELKHRIALEKTQMGRATSGLVYGNSTVFMAEHVVNMVYEHIHTYSIAVPANENIRQYIQTTDLQLLAWGLAMGIWSKGFHYERAVLDESGSASRVVTEKLNLQRMLIVDNNALTDWQKSHMSNRRPNSMTPAAVKKYQDEFVFMQGSTVKLGTKLMLKLKTPLLETYLQQGTRWVNSTVDMINRALGLDLDEQIRNTFVNEQAKTSTARQYSHWVNEIIFLDDEGNERSKVVDTAAIESALVAMSQDGDLVKDYMRAVRDFIDDVTFACICIPFLDEKDQNVYKRHPNLIPLDALHTFFTLIDQKASLIRMRETD
jgi:hypothetical protein